MWFLFWGWLQCLGRCAPVLPTHFHVEYITNHVWGPLGPRHMAISILGRTCIHFRTYFCRTSVILDPRLSNKTHFGLTLVKHDLFWTCICRASLILDLHLSNVTSVGLTFVELDPCWTYICRTSLMLDRHLSNLTYFRLTFFELDAFSHYICRT